LKLKTIAERLNCRLEGNGEIEIAGVAGIERAGPSDLTFFANRKYMAALRATRAAAVIVDDSIERAPCAILRAEQPYLAFARAVELFSDRWRPAPGVHRLALVGNDVSIGARTVVYPHATIGRQAEIGDDCIVHARVSVRERVRIGHRVVVQDGAVIGSDGFGFARRPDGTHHKIPQAGGVVIEDDVEIGANTTIDRPAVGETRIGAGTKIDNLVQIAHGVVVGRNVLLAAQVGIAGSSTIGDNVTLAGQVGVAGHLTIGEGVVATAQTGIPNSVGRGAFVSGYPALSNREWLKSSAVFRKLPDIKKAILDLQRRIEELEGRLGGDTTSAADPDDS
jgi:UDP-3-O-[3-hydroxymyristoyl] glucosamine N-acyltransferase